MTRVRVPAAILAMGLLCVACTRHGEADKHDTHRAPQAGAVGTSGSSAMTVADAVNGGVPAFVGREAHDAQIWKLTRQFYQKRANAPAWIEDRKPGRQMDELIAALQGGNRE